MTTATDPLMQSVNELKQLEHASTWRRYVELLEKKECTGSEAAQFYNCMQQLHKSESDVQSDRAALALLHHQEAVLVNGSGLEDQIQKAHRAYVDYEPKMRQAILAAQRHYNELRMSWEQLQGMTHSARDAINEIRRLKQQHPELLAGFEIPHGLGERITLEKFAGFGKRK